MRLFIYSILILGSLLSASTSQCFVLRDEPRLTDGVNNSIGPLHGIYFLNEYTGFCVGSYKYPQFNGVILYTTDGGSTWSTRYADERESSILLDICFVGEDTGFVTGNWGKILKTTDRGFTWFSQDFNTYKGLSGVSFPDANNGTIVGGAFFDPIILHTTNGGISWTEQPVDTFYDLYDVSFINVNTGIVGGNRTILRTTNAGTNWQRINYGPENSFLAVLMVDTLKVFSGGMGNIIKSSDGGLTWSQVHEDTVSGEILDIFFADSRIGWAASYFGAILQTTDYGSNWLHRFRDPTITLYTIFFTSCTTGWVAGNKGPFGIILNTLDGGLTWNYQLAPPIFPSENKLYQNFPNPFNSITTIKFEVRKQGSVRITIYDILGRVLAKVLDENKDVGSYTIDFDASRLASGVYFYQIVVEQEDDTMSRNKTMFIDSRKMVVLR
jgi:photosystem II stability/assembly factor-like uncharacterized protein